MGEGYAMAWHVSNQSTIVQRGILLDLRLDIIFMALIFLAAS